MQKIIKISISIIILYTSYTVATNGLGNIAFKKAEKQVAFWQQLASSKNANLYINSQANESLNLVSESSYQVTLEQINNALYWHTHPQYLETKAQVLEWGIRSNLQPDKTAGLHQAKSLYLQATELRPSWPTTWASLALVKWHLQEFDQQLLTYLNKAHQFGKNQPEVHLIWVQLASAIGKSNNPQLIEFIAPYQDKVNYHISQGLKDPRTKKQIEQVMTQ